MKKLLLAAGLLLSAGAAQAQIGNLVGAGLVMGVSAIKRARMTPEQKAAEQAAAQQIAAQKAAEQAARAAATNPASPAELRPQRTTADKLPKKGAEQITALEAQLEQCRAAMLASPSGPVCTPAQRTAIQQAAVAVARANAGWSLQPYQQEMAYYAAEDARRQQPAPAAK